MECNRDEAARAKEISEKKFEAKDYLGAKKFALKAQSLYPGLNGIQHMLTTLDVYISSFETQVNGESDWYRVLDVNPNADEETIRKQYRKLALVLHPDKNKSIGADGAFKLISEAWASLSDKSKRSVFDQKRNIKIVKPQVPPHGSNGVSSSNQSNTNPKTATQKKKPANRKRKTTNGTTTTQNYPITPTFWTVCHRCRLQHKYLLMYLHRNLLCPGCNLPYYAFEYPPPLHILKMPSQSNHFQQNQPGSTTGGSNPANPYMNPIYKTGTDPFGNQSIPAAQQAYERFKRENALNALKKEKEENLKRKHSGSKGEVGSSAANAAKKRKVVEDPIGKKSQGAKTSSVEADKRVKVNKPKSSRDLPNLDPKVLVDIAQKRIRRKLNEWKISSDVAVSKDDTGSATENGKLNDSVKGNHKNSELKSISVPDSDFHDFDKDRTETSFGENQVWAAYDDDDGMPRYYAIIHEVISPIPFKVRISWLNSKTNDELGPLNWVGSGFTKTCGQFRTGHRVISESINSFSHKVRWTKGDQGVVSVFPRKGDVWALYRNWSPKWNELTEDNFRHEYDMVEVLEDYDGEVGVRFSPLVKVAGFKTVFHRHRDEKQIKTICKEEMFRFSHQVPSFLLSGHEGENAPKGYRELDPAATPLELLQVISDGNDEKIKI